MGKKFKIMNLILELNKLKGYINSRDTFGFRTYLKELYEKSNQAEKETIYLFVETELTKSTNHIKSTVNNISMRLQLAEPV